MTCILLRRAKLVDAELIYEWRNHQSVREFSFNSRPLKMDSHMDWFKASLNMPDRYILIAEIDTEAVGVLRFDISGSTAEISIYLSPDHKGKGIGVDLLKEGKCWIQLNLSQVDCLRAQIISENVASLKTFERAGFKKASYIYECALCD